jgi:hypothetical protein
MPAEQGALYFIDVDDRGQMLFRRDASVLQIFREQNYILADGLLIRRVLTGIFQDFSKLSCRDPGTRRGILTQRFAE